MKHSDNNVAEVKHIISQLANRKIHILGQEQMLNAAVLVPLIQKNNEFNLLFQVRSHEMKHQPGDVCFPGGRIDRADKDEQATAIRETCEELGLTAQDINVIAPLDIFVTPFSRIVYPFVGEVKETSNIKPNPEEVAEVFYVPLTYFLTVEPKRYDVPLQPQPEHDFPYHLIHKGKDYQWRSASIPEYFYEYNDYVIWGMTARIIVHFVDLLRNNEQKL